MLCVSWLLVSWHPVILSRRWQHWRLTTTTMTTTIISSGVTEKENLPSFGRFKATKLAASKWLCPWTSGSAPGTRWGFCPRTIKQSRYTSNLQNLVQWPAKLQHTFLSSVQLGFNCNTNKHLTISNQKSRSEWVSWNACTWRTWILHIVCIVICIYISPLKRLGWQRFISVWWSLWWCWLAAQVSHSLSQHQKYSLNMNLNYFIIKFSNYGHFTYGTLRLLDSLHTV